MTVHYFLECLMSVIYINRFTHRAFYFVDLTFFRHKPSYEHLTLTLYGREQLHYLSINSTEKIPCPFFAVRSQLSNLAKLLNLC